MVTRLKIKTGSKVEFQDITHQVQKVISSSGIKNGACYVFVPHTTAGITINEHDDPSVVIDISEQLSRMVPDRSDYRRIPERILHHRLHELVEPREYLWTAKDQFLFVTKRVLHGGVEWNPESFADHSADDPMRVFLLGVQNIEMLLFGFPQYVSFRPQGVS